MSSQVVTDESLHGIEQETLSLEISVNGKTKTYFSTSSSNMVAASFWSTPFKLECLLLLPFVLSTLLGAEWWDLGGGWCEGCYYQDRHIIKCSLAQFLLELTLSLGVPEGSLTDSIGWGRCGWWVELDSPFKPPPFTAWIENSLILDVPYSRKIWWGIKFGRLAGCLSNRQIKIRQNFLLVYIRMAIPYRTTKFDSPICLHWQFGTQPPN